MKFSHKLSDSGHPRVMFSCPNRPTFRFCINHHRPNFVHFERLAILTATYLGIEDGTFGRYLGQKHEKQNE
jgi:hypothetical protein